MPRAGWLCFSLFLLLTLVRRANASEDSRRALVQAAAHDAISILRHDVLATSLSADVTVKEFVDQSGGRDALESVLRGAQQVGGTRWIADDTCMVRVEMSGEALAATLADIAKARPKDAPKLPASFEKRMLSLQSRTFSAEGSSTGASSTKELRPSEDNLPWRAVTPAARREAVATARAGATDRILNSLEEVRISGAKTFGDAFEVPSIRLALGEWLASRPVVEVHFHPDLNVELTLSAPAEEMWSVVRKALESQVEITSPASEAEWSRVHDDAVQHVAPGVGRAMAAKTAEGSETKSAAALPERAPRWVTDSVDAAGTAKKADGKLLTKKRAEDDALRDLRRQIEKLPLDEGHVLSDAAHADPAVNSAIDRALLRARVYKVDYRADGGVDVQYHLDLRVLWHELSNH